MFQMYNSRLVSINETELINRRDTARNIKRPGHSANKFAGRIFLGRSNFLFLNRIESNSISRVGMRQQREKF